MKKAERDIDNNSPPAPQHQNLFHTETDRKIVASDFFLDQPPPITTTSEVQRQLDQLTLRNLDCSNKAHFFEEDDNDVNEVGNFDDIDDVLTSTAFMHHRLGNHNAAFEFEDEEEVVVEEYDDDGELHEEVEESEERHTNSDSELPEDDSLSMPTDEDILFRRRHHHESSSSIVGEITTRKQNSGDCLGSPGLFGLSI